MGLLVKFLQERKNLTWYGVMDGKTDINSWDKSFYGQRIIRQEAILLNAYVKQGKIEDLNIPELSLKRIKSL